MVCLLYTVHGRSLDYTSVLSGGGVHVQVSAFFTKSDHSLLLLCGEWVVVCTVVHKQWLTTVYLSSSVPSSE